MADWGLLEGGGLGNSVTGTNKAVTAHLENRGPTVSRGLGFAKHGDIDHAAELMEGLAAIRAASTEDVGKSSSRRSRSSSSSSSASSAVVAPVRRGRLIRRTPRDIAAHSPTLPSSPTDADAAAAIRANHPVTSRSGWMASARDAASPTTTSVAGTFGSTSPPCSPTTAASPVDSQPEKDSKKSKRDEKPEKQSKDTKETESKKDSKDSKKDEKATKDSKEKKSDKAAKAEKESAKDSKDSKKKDSKDTDKAPKGEPPAKRKRE